ncbi:7881_t:CDS:2 [Acaulospora colombiana]|uniref:7881_t:CDS:1 n=1 Tax=Acaulospora colombiana TaxID=27376 RepID=A0ACA9L992_9GLOM|nr:7881_t:CDS:2 [Acaulospora colombiana]
MLASTLSSSSTLYTFRGGVARITVTFQIGLVNDISMKNLHYPDQFSAEKLRIINSVWFRVS